MSPNNTPHEGARELADGTYFVTGTDTDVGKTVATGVIARDLLDAKRRAATLKLVQTGCTAGSIDIALHRRIMGTALAEDNPQGEGVSAPQIFTFPASPHLAAELDHRALDFNAIERSTKTLESNYDIVLIEGAGGLMVPLTRSLLTIDYVCGKGWPVIFVTNARLGSINHTLLAWEALQSRGIRIGAVAFNDYCGEGVTPKEIFNDTRDYLRQEARRRFPEALWIEIPRLRL